MKTQEQLVRMQDKLRFAMSSLQAVGAPPEVIERSALGLWIADDAISWVLEKPSELARLEAEYDRSHQETHTANE